MIPLDIYRKRTHNKPIETRMEAWLAFLSEDSPERIIELIEKFPEFKPMYETLYQMCLDVERVMDMFFSEELRILDRNTVQYMMDEQQKELEEQQKTIVENMKQLALQREQIKDGIREIAEKKEQIATQDRELAEQKEKLAGQSKQIDEQKDIITAQAEEIARLKQELEKRTKA